MVLVGHIQVVILIVLSLSYQPSVRRLHIIIVKVVFEVYIAAAWVSTLLVPIVCHVGPLTVIGLVTPREVGRNVMTTHKLFRCQGGLCFESLIKSKVLMRR